MVIGIHPEVKKIVAAALLAGVLTVAYNFFVAGSNITFFITSLSEGIAFFILAVFIYPIFFKTPIKQMNGKLTFSVLSMILFMILSVIALGANFSALFSLGFAKAIITFIALMVVFRR